MGEFEARDEARQLVAFRVGPTRYGVPIECVIEMTQLGLTDPVAGGGDSVMGLMRLRNEVLPVIDLRRRFSLPSLESERQEAAAALARTRAEHQDWVGALEASVGEGAAFALATDPDECDFGGWLERFETSDDRLEDLLEKLGAAHADLHGAGARCLAAAAGGSADEAKRLLGAARNHEFSDFAAILDSVLRVFRSDRRQIAIVLRVGTAVAAVAVDRLDSVVSYAAEQVQALDPDAFGAAAKSVLDFVSGVVKPRGEGRLIQLLDVENLLSEARSMAASAAA